MVIEDASLMIISGFPRKSINLLVTMITLSFNVTGIDFVFGCGSDGFYISVVFNLLQTTASYNIA